VILMSTKNNSKAPPMTPDQFRAALASLELSQAGFARLAMVDARTVRRWCDGTRAVPGPVVALLRMMMVTDEWREIPITQWQRMSPKEP
jgi:DNA-binding transcriptional regulator YiaG